MSKPWAICNGGSTFTPIDDTCKAVPAGTYTYVINMAGVFLSQGKTINDELIDFPGSLPDKIIKEIDKFWQNGQLFAKYGFVHRRGMLFYGKPGTGKTCLIAQLVDRATKRGYITLYVGDPRELVTVVRKIREREPDRNLMCVFEDIDNLIDHYGDGSILQWLDGVDQTNKVINIATTNYLHDLDRRIANRPRRFDQVIEIGYPDRTMREAYFKRKLPEQPKIERAQWVKATQGLSFASLTETIVGVKCLQQPLVAVAERLRKLEGSKRR